MAEPGTPGYEKPRIRRIPCSFRQAFGQTCDPSGGAAVGGVCDGGARAEEGVCETGNFATGGFCDNGNLAVGGTCDSGLNATGGHCDTGGSPATHG